MRRNPSVQEQFFLTGFRGRCYIDVHVFFEPLTALDAVETLRLQMMQERLRMTAWKFSKVLEKRLNRYVELAAKGER